MRHWPLKQLNLSDRLVCVHAVAISMLHDHLRAPKNRNLRYGPLDQNFGSSFPLRSAGIHRQLPLDILWWLQNVGQPLFVYIIAILLRLGFESCTQTCHC